MNLNTVLAHCRPQPAIPAMLVLVITLLIALPAAGQPQPGAMVTWGVPLGLLASAGLALAAGFCSFFPPAAWLGIAWLAADTLTPASVPAAAPTHWVASGMCVIALGLQSWRVLTRRFVPSRDDGSRADTG